MILYVANNGTKRVTCKVALTLTQHPETNLFLPSQAGKFSGQFLELLSRGGAPAGSSAAAPLVMAPFVACALALKPMPKPFRTQTLARTQNFLHSDS
jgi:hypothetical protein